MHVDSMLLSPWFQFSETCPGSSRWYLPRLAGQFQELSHAADEQPEISKRNSRYDCCTRIVPASTSSRRVLRYFELEEIAGGTCAWQINVDYVNSRVQTCGHGLIVLASARSGESTVWILQDLIDVSSGNVQMELLLPRDCPTLQPLLLGSPTKWIKAYFRPSGLISLVSPYQLLHVS